MKKVFIISAVLLGVTLLFLAIYNFAFKKEAPVSSQPTAKEIVVDNTKNPIAPKKAEKITAISDRAVIGAMFDKKTEEITFYDAKDGTVWKMDSTGKGLKNISQTKIADLKNASWSPDHGKVLTTIQKDGKNVSYEYDYLLKKAVSMREGMDPIVWDNSGAKIFYKYFDNASKKETLNIANPDGTGWQKIADVQERYLEIAPVPLSSLVSFWNAPYASAESRLQIVGATGGEVKTILAGKFGGDYLWSPDGTLSLVSSLQGTTVSLGVVTIEGAYRELNIPTLASKCAWSMDSKTLYYALPGGIPAGSVMPNDYQQNKFNTNDTFWKVNVSTGEKQRIVDTAEISGKYDSNNMFLSPSEDALYFTNKIDQKLYRIAL